DLYRQPVGVGLKRVSRIAAVRINPSAALMEGQIILQKPLDQLERVRVSKVKKVAGMVEYKSILENGARQPAWFVRTLQERVIRSQMIGAGKTRHPPAQDKRARTHGASTGIRASQVPRTSAKTATTE